MENGGLAKQSVSFVSVRRLVHDLGPIAAVVASAAIMVAVLVAPTTRLAPSLLPEPMPATAPVAPQAGGAVVTHDTGGAIVRRGRPSLVRSTIVELATAPALPAGRAGAVGAARDSALAASSVTPTPAAASVAVPTVDVPAALDAVVPPDAIEPPDVVRRPATGRPATARKERARKSSEGVVATSTGERRGHGAAAATRAKPEHPSRPAIAQSRGRGPAR